MPNTIITNARILDCAGGDARLRCNSQVAQADCQEIALDHGDQAGRRRFCEVFDIRREFRFHWYQIVSVASPKGFSAVHQA